MPDRQIALAGIITLKSGTQFSLTAIWPLDNDEVEISFT
jgi:hypothetical protein